MPLKLIIILLIILSCFGCNPEYKFVSADEIIIKTENNIINFQNKENKNLNGTYSIFYLPSNFGGSWSSKLIEGEIVDGKLEGKITVYVQDPEYQSNFEKRKKDTIESDLTKEYALPYKVLNYKNGLLHGKSVVYDDNSKPLLISEFNDGQLISFVGFEQKNRKIFTNTDAEIDAELLKKTTQRIGLNLKDTKTQ